MRTLLRKDFFSYLRPFTPPSSKKPGCRRLPRPARRRELQLLPSGCRRPPLPPRALTPARARSYGGVPDDALRPYGCGGAPRPGVINVPLRTCSAQHLGCTHFNIEQVDRYEQVTRIWADTLPRCDGTRCLVLKLNRSVPDIAVYTAYIRQWIQQRCMCASKVHTQNPYELRNASWYLSILTPQQC